MFSVDNITVSFGSTDLFRDISFLVNEKERVGLVGKNGAGKSTILKIIAGIQHPTLGVVSKTSDCTIGYLPQQMATSDDTTLKEECGKAFSELLQLEEEIRECTESIEKSTDYQSKEYQNLLHRLHEATERYHFLDGGSREAQVEKILLGLGFKRDEFDKPTSAFSGGWRMRIEIAKILLRKPSVLLLDEPTNHLDIESIQWLEDYLISYKGAVMLISHDRAFLDNVTNRTIELSCGKAYDYKVNYSHFEELRKERRAQQMAAYENQQRMVEKTEEFIERFRYKPTKSNQVQSRIKALEKIERIEIDDEDVDAMTIRFPSAPRSGQIVVEAKDAAQYFGNHKVFEDVNIIVERGEKIALVGRNGEGKTTFIRQIMKELEPTKGETKVGYNVNIGYYAQNQEDLMEGDYTVFDTLDIVAVGDIRTRLRDILGAFLFRGNDIDKKVKVLSGGERARLAIAKLMLEPYNLLVLDEPTNHMDMRSRMVLKQALQKYDGTVIVISHDRDFLSGLVGTVYEFRDGHTRQFLGGISDFLEKRRIENLRDIEKKETKEVKAQQSEKTAPTEEVKPQLSYNEKKELDRKKTRLQSAIRKLEGDIEKLESEISELEAKLLNPEDYSIKLVEDYTKLKESLDSKMEEWTSKQEEFENYG